MMKSFFIHTESVPKLLLLANCTMAFVYYLWWLNFSHVGNPWIYGLLFFGETYHVIMSYLFWFTIWPFKRAEAINSEQYSLQYQPSVDIFIPVVNEPIEFIRETALAAKTQTYANKLVYLLNDGYVAKRENWKQVEMLARELGINCITRKKPGGAKAGNINNALQQTSGEIIVIFDADMAPFPNFLERTIPYFHDTNIGFVQTPQYYKNYGKNEITQASWEQQELFYGPIMRGKDSYNSAFLCGTNVAIRRYALQMVGGLVENSVTEDFLTSIRIHQKGFRSIYLTEVLAMGLAPEDLLSYYKQQRRWARGSIEVLFLENPFFKRGLTMRQRFQYLASALYYLNGLIVLIDMLMPLTYLFFGIKPVISTTVNFAFFFAPFMFLNLLTLYLVSDKNITFRALAFSQSSFTLQLSALFSALLRKKDTFTITSKKALAGNFSFLAYPHILYIISVAFAIVIALHREGINPSIVTNIAWALFNITMFYPFVKASFASQKATEQVDKTSYVNKPVPEILGI